MSEKVAPLLHLRDIVSRFTFSKHNDVDDGADPLSECKVTCVIRRAATITASVSGVVYVHPGTGQLAAGIVVVV